MEDKIESERNGRNINMITELNLDNCKSTTIVGLSENWTSLEKLSLINVGLNSLKGFPKLPKLTKLKLCDNKLSEGFDALTILPNLAHLNLSGNKISDFKDLAVLNKIATLRSLNLLSCDISSQESYKEKIFDMIPQLVYLDGFDKEENSEVEVCNDSDLANEEEEELEDEDEEEDLDEEDSCEEEEEDIPLEALYNKSYTNDTADDDDFEVIEEEDVDEDIDEEDVEDELDEENEDPAVTSPADAQGKARGIKRKHENEEVQQNGKKA